MTRLDEINNYGKELRETLFLTSYPLAVKMLEKEEDIPPGAQRPLKDLGWHMTQCQAFAMSRRNKTSIAIAKEDSWCPEAVIGYGFAEPPEFFLEGHNRYPEGNVETLDAGRTWAQAFPRLEPGRYSVIVSAPLEITNFEPDVVVVYCNPGQLTMLLSAGFWKTGKDYKCTLSPCSACVYAVVLAIQTGEYQVASPCAGDRTIAMAQDNELIFSIPLAKLEEFITGLRSIANDRRSLPVKFVMPHDLVLPDEAYAKLCHLVGIDV